MKVAILFCVVAFACAAQALPSDLSRIDQVEEAKIDEVQKRGSMIEAAKEKLELAKSKLDSLVRKAVDGLKDNNKINEAKKLAEDLMEKLKAAARQTTEKIYGSLQELQNKVDNSILQLEQYANALGLDVPECTKMVKTVRHAITATIANSSSCIVEKIDAGKALVLDITGTLKEALAEINQLKQDGGVCLENIDGVTAMVPASACIGKTAAKASWMVTNKIPSIASDVTKITTLLSTLQPSLSLCLTKKSAETIAQQTTTVLGDVKECVKQKIYKESVGALKAKIPHVGNSDLTAAIGGQIDKILDVPNAIGGQINKILDVPDVIGDHVGKIPDVIGGNVGKISDVIADHVGKIPDVIGGNVGKISDVIGDHVGNIPNVIGGNVGKISDVIGDNVGKIPNVIGGPAKEISNTIGKYANKVPFFG